MKKLPIPGLQDVVRVVRPSLDETVDELVAYYLRRPGGFSYAAARRIARAVLSGEISLEMALAWCRSLRNSAARRPNEEIVRLLHSTFFGRTLFCHHLKGRVLPIRDDMAIPFPNAFYYVENSTVVIPWFQMRRNYGLSEEQMALLGHILKEAYARDDFSAATIELYDLRKPDDKAQRELSIYQLSDLPTMSPADATSALNKFALAHDRVSAMNIERPARRKKKDDQRPQPGLFE